ncbi:MBL fold metallo-hydrolase [Paenibacillus koleovorans]|uniref:MBL fold metallo-hydrolase n=1 Tax=Paenibacillus koleovorans TaxID=121608 RepID=UPI000FD97F50|nr:MBL fold metallo-hydrolase [Paenibacillus koleovorans]
MSPSTLTFLGTGDSIGVPRVYCDCEVCTEARSTGVNRRYRSSALLTGDEGQRLLIDCGPDWLDQMRLMELRQLDHALITHAHHDHIAGLPEWADACRWTGLKGNVYAPADVFVTVRSQYPWLERHLRFHNNDAGCRFGEWSIFPTPVNHGRNGMSYAYVFEKTGYRWAYCSDAILLSEQQKEPLKRLDLLVLGTNYYKENAEPGSRSVYDMTEGVQLMEELLPGRVVFTHMSHGVDGRNRYELPERVSLAFHGLSISLL